MCIISLHARNEENAAPRIGCRHSSLRNQFPKSCNAKPPEPIPSKSILRFQFTDLLPQ